MLNSQAVHTLTTILQDIINPTPDNIQFSLDSDLDEEVLHCHPCHLPHPDEDSQKEVRTKLFLKFRMMIVCSVLPEPSYDYNQFTDQSILYYGIPKHNVGLYS